MSVHQTFISFFSGRSEMIVLSVFSRRSTNGPVARFRAAAASSSWRTSIGSWNRRRNRFAGPSRPGLQKSMMDHSSARWFSTGVPVRASRVRAGIARTAWACRVPLFLIAWASSQTTRPQAISRSSGQIPRAVP